MKRVMQRAMEERFKGYYFNTTERNIPIPSFVKV